MAGFYLSDDEALVSYNKESWFVYLFIFINFRDYLVSLTVVPIQGAS